MTRLLPAVLLGLALALAAKAADAKPNVLLIMADDLGFSDLGCYGGEIRTPHLDTLAGNGLRYTQFYNTARCWPTRAALLTGYYAQQVGRDKLPGVAGGNRGGRPVWAPLLSVHLKKAGYHSYHSGKWHLDGMPLQNGFERSYYLKDQSRFFSPQIHWEDDVKLPPVKRGTGYYGTIAVANAAITHLKHHQANHPESPFFQYVAFAAPHFPLHALPEDIAKCLARYEPGWDAIRAQRWKRVQALGLVESSLSKVERDLGPPYHFPDHLKILGEVEVNRPVPWNDLNKAQQRFQQTKMAIHAAMIERMDSEIGRIMAQIRAMKAFENTLVIFLSDNGASAELMVRGDGHNPKAPLGSADTYPCLGPGWSTVSNTPFRRHKTWVHEGGCATPFIAHWPGGIKERNKLRRTPAHVIDVVPTILDLAGLELNRQVPSPGRSLGRTFLEDGRPLHEKLWWLHDGHRALRVGDWKLVAAKDQPWELFHLAVDRTETRNLAKEHPAKVLAMADQWNSLTNSFASPAREIAPK
jgi:arylsulfatase A-like enzyme